VTWGGWAGLAWAAWQLFWALLVWRDTRGKEKSTRKFLANEFPLPWER
jgi:hypothetical protein